MAGMRILRSLAVLAVGGAVAIAATRAHASCVASEGQRRSRFAAVAFDYLVLFNSDSVVAVADRVAPGRGRELTSLWRTRQFEYSWLRSMTGRYVDFSRITEDALVYTAHAMQVDLTTSQEQQLRDAYLHLAPWPDTAGALRRLRDDNVRVITIATFSPEILRSNAANAGMSSLFDVLVSTDANHTYKPDPRAYQLGIDWLERPKQDIVFAAFGGWDAAGAKSFGYPTVWVNRLHQPPEELGLPPDRTVSDLAGLLDFVLDAPAIPGAGD